MYSSVDKAKIVFDALCDYTIKCGQSPSIHELAARTGIPYPSVRRCLSKLVEQDLIIWQPCTVRGITIKHEIQATQDRATLVLLDHLIQLGQLAQKLKLGKLDGAIGSLKHIDFNTKGET
jgi:hypothetical protein